MTKTISLTSLVLAAMAQGAAAHPGEHGFSAAGSLAHLLTQPDHLAVIAIAAGIAGFIWRRARTKA